MNPSLIIKASFILIVSAVCCIMGSCSSDSKDEKIDIDVVAPVITVVTPELTCKANQTYQVTVSKGSLIIGSSLVASWSDDRTPVEEIRYSLTFNGKAVALGEKLTQSGDLRLKVRDAASNVDSALIKIQYDNAPKIQVRKETANVFGGQVVKVEKGSLMIGDILMATWSDDNTPVEKLKVELTFNDAPFKAGESIDAAGILTLTITDPGSETSAVKPFLLTSVGLQGSGVKYLQVDVPANLLEGLTPASGFSITKVEVVMDGKTVQVEPEKYTPEYPASQCSIVYTLTRADGVVRQVTNYLEIKPMQYVSVPLQTANLRKNWDEWKRDVDGNQNWSNFYETTGHLQTRRLLEELDKMGGKERAEKLSRLRLMGLGECPTMDCEQVKSLWESSSGVPGYDSHANMMMQKIKTSNSRFPGIAQTYPGKVRFVYEQNEIQALYNYVKSHPNEKFIVFCANDVISSADVVGNEDEAQCMNEMVSLDNCFVIEAAHNVRQGQNFLLEQHQPQIEEGIYCGASIQGKHSFAAIGGQHDMTVSFSDFSGEVNHTLLPVGFNQRNLKVSSGWPFYGNNHYYIDKYDATSSPAAGELAATSWNIMALMPDMDFDTFMDLINTYSIAIPATYNGKKIEDYNTPNQKEICRQLCLPKIPGGLSASQQPIELPRSKNYPAILWTGEGVEYNINGEWKAMTGNNLSSASDIRNVALNATFRFNPALARKMKNYTTTLKVQAITSDGESIPEVEWSNTFMMQ